MSRFLAAVDESAQKFSIDDAVGIAEVIISVIKECQARRNGAEAIKAGTVGRGGIVARLSLRRAFRNRGYSMREAGFLAQEALEKANNEPELLSEAIDLAEEVI